MMPCRRLPFLVLLSSLIQSATVADVVDPAAITQAFGACVSDAGVNFNCIQGAIAQLDLDPTVLASLASCAGTDPANINIATTTACVQETLAGLVGDDHAGDDEAQDTTEPPPGDEDTDDEDDPDSSHRFSATLAISFVGLASMLL